MLTSTQNEHLKNISITTEPTPRPASALVETVNDATKQDTAATTKTVPAKQIEFKQVSSSSSSSSPSSPSSPLLFSNKPPPTSSSKIVEIKLETNESEQKLSTSRNNADDDEDEDTVSDKLVYQKTSPSKSKPKAERKDRNPSYEDDFDSSF